ncbi:MAG: hypothetical protein V3U83_05940 [Acidobacteriota bacterium]
MRTFFLSCAIALLAWPVQARQDGTPAGTAGDADRDTIEMHVGIPGLVYVGQSLAELKTRFSEIESSNFAGDEKVRIVRIVDRGVSCFVAGDSEEAMQVISVGFNFEGTYEGVGESGYRTIEGIGKGSTVNDLLGIYGRAEITSAGQKSFMQRRKANARPDPNEPKKYLFASDDGRVKTYFQSEGAQVVRMVINHLALIDQYILKRQTPR